MSKASKLSNALEAASVLNARLRAENTVLSGAAKSLQEQLQAATQPPPAPPPPPPPPAAVAAPVPPPAPRNAREAFRQSIQRHADASRRLRESA